jgi:hypothetical protein
VVSDDAEATPDEPDREWCRRALDHPEVTGVDCEAGTVRVRLRSGIELEWPCEGEHPA